MFRKIFTVIIVLMIAVASVTAANKSDKMKPRWLTSSLPTPKSPDYFILSAQGSGKTLAEARQMSLFHLAEELEHKRGLVVNSKISATETEERNSGMNVDSKFTIEITEKGKLIEVTCQVLDEYWERSKGEYDVYRLYAVNNPKSQGKGLENANFSKTTSYGAAPVFYSLIPGVGQIYKGSTTKGSIILGSAVVGGDGISNAESIRAD